MKKLLLVPGLAFFLLAPARVLGQPVKAPPTPAPGVHAEFVRAEPEEPLPSPIAAAVAQLEVKALATHIAFLASPALEGRGLGSRGLDAALQYVAAQLSLAGVPPLRPAGEAKGVLSAYFQAVPLREIRGPGGSVELELGGGGSGVRHTFVHGMDVVLPALAARSVSAGIVFAGYGIRETSPLRDDYLGLDVKGKVVVVREGVPPGEAWRGSELLARYAAEDVDDRWFAKAQTAKALGAIALIGIEGEEWTARILGKEKPSPFAFRGLEDYRTQQEPLVVRASPAFGEALLGPPGLSAERPRAFPGISVTIRVKGQEQLGESRNVVGVLMGSDPERRQEAVVLGAHVDHLGMVDGVVHPGADDNASGTAALLEIARAFAASPVKPKRTLVFAFWTGEEEDHIGSEFWVRHPLWPLDKTTAYVNLDMIGHPWLIEEIRTLVEKSELPNGKDFLSHLTPADFIEPGVALFAPQLGPILSRAGRGTGLNLHLDWTDGVRGGSDYRAFARARVPFVRFFGNFFPGYHEPTDTAEALDPAPASRVARLALATAWLLADR